MNRTEILVIIAAGVMAIIMALLYSNADASGNHGHDVVINNYYDTPDPADVGTQSTDVTNLSITNGVSEQDLARGVAMAGAQHNFDYSTTDWQLGVAGATYAGENALSLGVAKRFGDDSWVPNILLHGSFSDSGGNDQLITFGASFRL